MPDFSAQQGDHGSIVWSDTLTYSDGTAADLTGATVKLVARKRTANAPYINATATIVSAVAGTVSYTPTADDTRYAGMLNGSWVVTFSGGAVQTWPTVGYLTIEITENLLTPNQTIVELDDVKDYLNLSPTDRKHDSELMRFLAGLTPVVEFLVGPVLPRTYTNERYDGGTDTISLRHRPLISVAAVTEYVGPTPYPLTQISSRDQGSIYSFEFDPSGSIIRTTAGGGTRAFPAGADTVQVTYTAGRATTPENIRMGILDYLRSEYQQTQQGGGPFGGGGSADDDMAILPPTSFITSNRVRGFLAPDRRHPSTL